MRLRIATRDYARPQRPRSPAPRTPQARQKMPQGRRPASGQRAALSLPLWAWMVVSLSLLVFGAALYFISRPVAPMDMVSSSSARKAAQTVEIPPKEPTRFDFYAMLPSYEVVVPEEVRNPPKPGSGSNLGNRTPRIEPAPANGAAMTTAAAGKAVKPAAILPAPAPAPAPAGQAQAIPPSKAGEQFLIQVAAFRSRVDAEQRVASLALAGLSSRVEQVSIDHETWFRVRLGPYNSTVAAEAAQQALKKQGFSGVVMKVKG